MCTASPWYEVCSLFIWSICFQWDHCIRITQSDQGHPSKEDNYVNIICVETPSKLRLVSVTQRVQRTNVYYQMLCVSRIQCSETVEMLEIMGYSMALKYSIGNRLTNFRDIERFHPALLRGGEVLVRGNSF